MRGLMGAILSLGLATAALADDYPVVVELFTSQGCSSCPPADAFLSKLAGRDDVIPLALHVDYWDYIGWKDVFAQPGFTKRQKSYARAAGARTIYTPQMVVGGVDHVVGLHPMEVMDHIAMHRAAADTVTLAVARDGDRLDIRVDALAELPDTTLVQLVRYDPEETVSIKRGENAGRTMEYTNIVTHWQPLAEWDGTKPLSMSVDLTGDEPVIVIVQAAGPGRILAVARLR